ncbi:MAG: DinB family protein [bacterium]|nr:DinB family protein [bacterium]
MDAALKESLWKQFGAAIDMLEQAISECPAELWDTQEKFWYKAYHTLFFLDYYLSSDPKSFSPPAPFSLSEFDNSGTLPERVYSKVELVTYVKQCYEKCRQRIERITAQNSHERWVNEYRNYSTFEILIYNMRHVQHHTGQLYLLLRQGAGKAPRWVSQTPSTVS